MGKIRKDRKKKKQRETETEEGGEKKKGGEGGGGKQLIDEMYRDLHIYNIVGTKVFFQLKGLGRYLECIL